MIVIVILIVIVIVMVIVMVIVIMEGKMVIVIVIMEEAVAWVEGGAAVALAPAGRPWGLLRGSRTVVLTSEEARGPASWQSPSRRPLIVSPAP